MTSLTKNVVLAAIAVVLLVAIAYHYDSTLFGLVGTRSGFTNPPMDSTMPAMPAMPAMPSPEEEEEKKMSAEGFANHQNKSGSVVGVKSEGIKTKGEGFADLASMEGPAAFASAEAPAGCYPRDQLTPVELLPADQNTIYAQQNPMGVGSLKGKNFLSAGALIGVNTVGQSLRNANLQLRSEPPNPQVPVSIFLQSTIGPDISHRPLEVGS